MLTHLHLRNLTVALVGSLALASCNSGQPPGMVAPGGSKPPQDVSVVTIKPQRVTLSTDLPGRTSPYRVAEVRPQVNGVLLKRMFIEGTDVKEGQQLYQIDPAPYQAALDSAQAAHGARGGGAGHGQPAGATLPTAQKHQRRQQAGLRPNYGHRKAGGGRCRVGQGRSRDGADQSYLYQESSRRSRAAPAAPSPRGAGHGEPGQAAGHRSSSSTRSTSTSRSRRRSCTRLRREVACGPDQVGRRQ